MNSLNCLSLALLIFIHSAITIGTETTVFVANKNGQHSTLTEVPTDSDTPPPATDNGEGDSKMRSKVFSDAKSFDKLFLEGQKAYHDHLWYSCAHKLESAIELYRAYRETITECRMQCLSGNKPTKMSEFSITVSDFANFTFFLHNADCMRRCRGERLGDQKSVTSDYDISFIQRRPYQYLQFCYFKLEKPEKAAAATYTYYLANPEDADVKTNMEYYKTTLRIPHKYFVDLEMDPYREHYIRGTLAYVDKNWSQVVTNMEKCLTQYFQEHARCQANCFDTGRISGVEFLTGVGDLVIKVMVCQMGCEDKLSKLYTEEDPNFLSSIFHYLQYAHYQMEDLEKSAEATASFLLLDDSHEIMKENKKVIKDYLKITDEDFVPRESLQQYVKRRKELFANMDFINKNYKWGDISEEEGNIGEEILTEDTYIPDEWMTRYEKLGMHLMAKASDLQRAERFVTDGLLKQEHCDELVKLMDGVPKQANGAQVFNLKFAQQAMTERLDENYEASLRMLIRSSEVVRHYTQRYNVPDDSYVLKKTLIVCWRPDEDPNEKLRCYPQEDGTCLKYKDMSEDYFKDLFTTVTYLTDVDKGGDFKFLGDNEEVDYSTYIRCGRTVGFNTGDRHTLEVPRGDDGAKRCAMVINHSTFSTDDEKEYKETIALLHRLDEMRLELNMRSSKDVMKTFHDDGVRVAKTGEELQGKERFVVDGMASAQQCIDLTDMVQSDAIFGDGYEHLTEKPSLISPHTKHELYRGITIYRAAKMMHSGKISLPAMKAFLELSESARLFVERYFNMTKPLYFDFTHLVCRTAVDDSNEDRPDLSHPVHADNCVLQPNGTCSKGYPAFTQRDYSAVLYVNDDFKGGDFFFAHSNTTEQVSVQPKCGRLVGFNAGEFHGVRAVTSGSRCAMALWFTHNANFKELAHLQARKVHKEMEEEQSRKAPIHDDL